MPILQMPYINRYKCFSEESVNKDSMEAFNLLAQGKRNVLCGEMPQAINQLQEACRLL